MPLGPLSLHLWPEDALEEWRERAAIVWASDRNATEADWPAAKEAAERMVRRRAMLTRADSKRKAP